MPLKIIICRYVRDASKKGKVLAAGLASFLNQVRVAGEQGGALEHPAEILFAGGAVLAVGALEALEGLVADFQPFQLHDADEIFAAFPRLALFQFHAYTIVFPVRGGEC